MHSTVQYGTETLRMVKTLKMRQETIYDSSGTDKLYTKINLVVQGVMSACFEDENGYNVEAPAKQVPNQREYWLTPRRRLQYTVDGHKIIDSPWHSQLAGQVASGNSRDENNGPKPIRFDVIKLDGGKTFIVEWEVETWINECDAKYVFPSSGIRKPKADPVLSNRWEMKENIGTDYLSTRTITGVLVMSGIMNSPNVSPDSFRNVIFPPLPDGWKRESIDVTVAKDNLRLTYTVIDKQLHIPMPKPAVDISFTYRQVWGKANAFSFGEQTGIMDNDLSVRVKGEKGAKMKDLLQIAVKCLFSRMKLTPIGKAGKVKANGEWIESGSITERPWENEIAIELKTKSSPPNKNIKDLGMTAYSHRLGAIIDIPDIINNKARDPGTRADYTAFIFGQFLSGPCDSNKSPPYPASTKSEKTPKARVTVRRPYPYDDNTSPNKYDKKQTDEMPYIGYSIDVRISKDMNTFQLPVGSSEKNAECRFASVAAPVSKKIVNWSVARAGKHPDLPDPDVGEDHVLLNVVISPAVTTLAPDGNTERFSISGTYTYGLRKPLDFTKDIPVASWPLSESKFGDKTNVIKKDQWKKNIIGRGSSPGSAAN